MRLLFALSTALGLIVSFADTKNAFQQLLPPAEQHCLEINDACRSWHCKRLGKGVDPKERIIPVNKVLQGHPEASTLWEKMAAGALESGELSFKAMMHERNLRHS